MARERVKTVTSDDAIGLRTGVAGLRGIPCWPPPLQDRSIHSPTDWCLRSVLPCHRWLNLHGEPAERPGGAGSVQGDVGRSVTHGSCRFRRHVIRVTRRSLIHSLQGIDTLRAFMPQLHPSELPQFMHL